MVTNPTTADVRVADGLRPPVYVVDVLVAKPTPVGASRALGALLAGAARAVIQAAQPFQLTFAIAALAEGCVTAPTELVDEAARLPAVSARQQGLLECFARGVSGDRALAGRVGVSVATVRRDVQELYESLEVSGRPALAEAARRLGYG
jgi:DNA-binding NarL/FixJ family response regulator